VASKRLLPVFVKLLKDKEAEVRSAAAGAIGPLVGHIPSTEPLLEYISPLLEPLSTDPVQTVRVSFSKNVVELVRAFGKTHAQKIVLPRIEQMAKDEHHEVRNNVIERIGELGDALGPMSEGQGLGASLLPSLIELAKDPKWRVRMAVVDQSSVLAQQLGVKNFEKRMQQIIIVALSDHVFAIRESACEQIGKIVAQFGGQWAAEKFFPTAFLIYDKTTNYLHRMTCLLLISNVTKHCSSDVIDKDLLPLVISSCVDEVANVRIQACRTLATIIPNVDKGLAQSKILPSLQNLAKDPDEDVAFFAGEAIALCE
jgi:serine/threonine-protein phosphatase 2A regulatory subunit A